ncbi:MAG: DUF493 domain-containing protein [Pseudomonadales bacterium]|nr:DUF493 domain-containing protein [Pseudomonadales bacterium]
MDQEPPKVEFPCQYPIKVMGQAAPDFKRFVYDTIKKHADDLEYENVSIRESRTGKFHAVTVTIEATGTPQLEAIFKSLKDSGRIKLVL